MSKSGFLESPSQFVVNERGLACRICARCREAVPFVNAVFDLQKNEWLCRGCADGEGEQINGSNP